MKKSNLSGKLAFKKRTISNLNQIKGGINDVEVISATADTNTNLYNCTALTKNRLTCQTGLHFTCDHSYRVCPVEIDKEIIIRF